MADRESGPLRKANQYPQMKNIALLAIFAVVAILLSACQSSQSTSESSKAGKSANSEVDSVNSLAQTEPAAPAANAENLAANAVNSTGSLEDMKARKMQAMRGPLSDQPGIATKAQPFTRPAPDNSVYTVTLADEAVETRTFKDNPQLVRVEKRSNGSQSSIKVFLKDGRVIDLPGDKIAAMSMASAADILAAAGVGHGGPSASKKAAQASSH